MLNLHTPQTKRDAVSKLIFELSKLPGIGEKTATRLAYYILKQDESAAIALADSIRSAKQKIKLCPECFTFTDIENDFCNICSDQRKNKSVICVVERPSDILPLEQTGSHHGVYHVLHGVISPLDGIGPEDLKITELLKRIQRLEQTTPVQEIILATNPTVEGETTALYLARLLKPIGIKTTRLAHGLPVGGALEFADRQTVSRALQNRTEVRS